jgi:hypothetical protein
VIFRAFRGCIERVSGPRPSQSLAEIAEIVCGIKWRSEKSGSEGCGIATIARSVFSLNLPESQWSSTLPAVLT